MAGIVESGREKTDLFAASHLVCFLAQSGHCADVLRCLLFDPKRTLGRIAKRDITQVFAYEGTKFAHAHFLMGA